MTRQREQDALVGDFEVARGGGLLLLLEALVAGEERETGDGRDGFFEINRLGVLSAIDAAAGRQVVFSGGVVADEVADEGARSGVGERSCGEEDRR